MSRPIARAPSLVIRPRPRWQVARPGDLWEFRDLLSTLAGRDIRLRYRQTALGAIWVVLQPLLAALIFTFVFGRVAGLSSNGVPYIVFAYAGLLGWNFFSAVLTRSSGVLLGNAAMVSKVFFPRMLLPLSTVGSALIDFAVAGLIMVVLLVVYGVAPGLALLMLPVWLVLLLMMALGVGMAAGALAVRYRDVQYVLPVMVQFLLFASPVAYGLDAVPEGARRLYELNPLAGLLEGVRWSLLGQPAPPVGAVVWSACAAAVVAIAGSVIFASLERDFADVI